MPNRNFDCVDVVLLPQIMQTIELNFYTNNYWIMIIINDGAFCNQTGNVKCSKKYTKQYPYTSYAFHYILSFHSEFLFDIFISK